MSVHDILEYERLPDSVKRVAQQYFTRVLAGVDLVAFYKEAYNQGYSDASIEYAKRLEDIQEEYERTKCVE